MTIPGGIQVNPRFCTSLKSFVLNFAGKCLKYLHYLGIGRMEKEKSFSFKGSQAKHS